MPSYDIDFAWHTHMLSSTTCYLRETEALADAPGGVDHDDSVNQRHEDRKLHLGAAHNAPADTPHATPASRRSATRAGVMTSRLRVSLSEIICTSKRRRAAR